MQPQAVCIKVNHFLGLPLPSDAWRFELGGLMPSFCTIRRATTDAQMITSSKLQAVVARSAQDVVFWSVLSKQVTGDPRSHLLDDNLRTVGKITS